MRNKLRALLIAAGLFAGAPAFGAGPVAVEVFKNPACGCCGKWIMHLQDAGFQVRAYEIPNLGAVRTSLGMPAAYASCHTAKVGGYVVEGHVPAADIRRLLAERPNAKGLAVPMMPGRAPGMDVPNAPPYETLLVQSDGSPRTFARH